jgi:hypothetical protein
MILSIYRSSEDADVFGIWKSKEKRYGNIDDLINTLVDRA